MRLFIDALLGGDAVRGSPGGAPRGEQWQSRRRSCCPPLLRLPRWPPPRTSGEKWGGRSSPPRPVPAHHRRHLNVVGYLAEAVRCWEPVVIVRSLFILHSLENDRESSRGVWSYLDLLEDEGDGGHPHRWAAGSFSRDPRGAVIYFPQDGLTILFLLSLSFYFIAFMKQRRMGLNDFIQKIATNSYACKQ